ncbi:MAG: glycosyl-4,4'-diaponeurosporenoate acyltransferase [Verrucomicrobiales bacterium]|jgi:glycosyl-4,4'-diaponeurosporenoate acyltransferase
MLVELSGVWIVISNVVMIPVIHLSISWWFTRMPARRFDSDSFFSRERRWERGGRIYRRFFQIHRWKNWLPDAAPWFAGLPKKQLASADPDYLSAFVIETRRGEAAHLAQIAALQITLIWNPWPAAAVAIFIYAVASNLPCILLQRFNRIRMQRLLHKLEG